MEPMGGKRPRRCARPRLIPGVAFGIGLAACLAASPARGVDMSALLTPDLAAADWVSGADAFAGVDASDSMLFSYGGFTLAPGGLDRDGWRVRVYAGAGHYTFKSSVALMGGVVEFDQRADVLQAEALMGWQVSQGRMTAKLFAGIAYEDQAISPTSPEDMLAGENVGAKVALETWFDLSPRAWVSADASYATTFESYSGAVKLGLRPLAALSLGPELAAFGRSDFDGHRFGAFARWHCGGCDVTVAGGVSGDYEDETGAYGTLSLYRRF